jgi:hypothetical protein
LDIIAKIGIGMLVAAVAVAIPVVLNLPRSWLGGVIVLALAANGIVLLVTAARTARRKD